MAGSSYNGVTPKYVSGSATWKLNTNSFIEDGFVYVGCGFSLKKINSDWWLLRRKGFRDTRVRGSDLEKIVENAKGAK